VACHDINRPMPRLGMSFEMRVVAPLAVEPAKLRLIVERINDGGEFRYVMLRREYALPAAG